MLKKLIFSLTLFFAFSLNPTQAFAENNVNVYLFWGEGCPHCAREKPFLESLEKKYQNVSLHEYEVWYDAGSRDLFAKVGTELDVNVNAVPFTIIGEKHIQGYLNDETTGKEIEDHIKYCSSSKCNDPVSEILAINTEERKIQLEEEKNKKISEEDIPEELALPIFGTIKPRDVSLPVLTLIIAALDGFNPCAMWTLIFLISLLIGMHDKKKMWILGSTFIVASAGVYFLFMATWLHLILFIGFIFWIRLVISLVAIAGGIYNLKEYFTNKDSACKVTNTKERQMVFEKLKKLTHEKNFWLAFCGIILLAAAVNIVELICSAGFPVVYTQILTLSNLATWQYYLYLLFYIFIFMLDDLIVFIISMKTLEITGVTTKYSRFSHLIGGILMTAIGLILMLKPELLMFG